jgi:hypothetical protein
VPWLTGYQNKGEKKKYSRKVTKKSEKARHFVSYRKYGELLFKSYQKFQL